jgi:hypothetical protein
MVEYLPSNCEALSPNPSTAKKKKRKKERLSYYLSDHNRIKLEIKTKRNYRKHSNAHRLNISLLNDHWVIKEKGKK